MVNYLLGILIAVIAGVAFGISSVTARIAGLKFRGKMGEKLNQSHFFTLFQMLLNGAFILSSTTGLIGGLFKMMAPSIAESASITVPLIYATSYLSTMISSYLWIGEKITKHEIIAVILLIFAIIFQLIGTMEVI